MSLTSVASGSQTAVVGTEHILSTQTTAGIYIFVVDTSNLTYGDELELRIKTKATSTSTSQLAYSAFYAHVQGEPIKYSPPVPVSDEIIVTLKQSAGTARTFDWNLLKT